MVALIDSLLVARPDSPPASPRLKIAVSRALAIEYDEKVAPILLPEKTPLGAIFGLVKYGASIRIVYGCPTPALDFLRHPGQLGCDDAAASPGSAHELRCLHAAV